MSSMSASLADKVAPKLVQRRLLQNYIQRLDETIVDLVSAERTGQPIGTACRFCADNIVVWNDQPHAFSTGTYVLLREFFAASRLMLTKEDIRQDVLFHDDAREGSIRQCIFEARKELQSCNFPYRIETIPKRGYRLVAE